MGIISREIIGYIIVLQIKRHAHETRSHARLWSNGLQWHNQPRPILLTPWCGLFTQGSVFLLPMEGLRD